MIVPANTGSPDSLATGIDSPVIGAWFTVLDPDTTWPSSAIRAPGFTNTTSPNATSPVATVTQASLRRTVAVSGASATRERIA